MKISTPSVLPLSLTDQKTGTMSKVAGAKGVTMEKIDKTAKEFEAQFISQMLSSMFSTRDLKAGLGGSEAEETFQTFMVQEYGHIISRAGGIGVADQIKRSMLQLQEKGKTDGSSPTA